MALGKIVSDQLLNCVCQINLQQPVQWNLYRSFGLAMEYAGGSDVILALHKLNACVFACVRACFGNCKIVNLFLLII